MHLRRDSVVAGGKIRSRGCEAAGTASLQLCPPCFNATNGACNAGVPCICCWRVSTSTVVGLLSRSASLFTGLRLASPCDICCPSLLHFGGQSFLHCFLCIATCIWHVGRHAVEASIVLVGGDAASHSSLDALTTHAVIVWASTGAWAAATTCNFRGLLRCDCHLDMPVLHHWTHVPTGPVGCNQLVELGEGTTVWYSPGETDMMHKHSNDNSSNKTCQRDLGLQRIR